MQRTLIFLLAVSLAALASAPARADFDLAVSGLIGTGVDTGSADNNPYVLQLGAAGDLIINGFVLGIRGTRSLGSDSSCSGCQNVDDVRTIGADLGREWTLALLHIGPRFGIGSLKEHGSDNRAAYLEPGAVAEVELAIFTAGVDLRYRVALGDSEYNGFLAYAKLGLRF